LTFLKKCVRGVALAREHPGKLLEIAGVQGAHLHAVVGFDDDDLTDP